VEDIRYLKQLTDYQPVGRWSPAWMSSKEGTRQIQLWGQDSNFWPNFVSRRRRRRRLFAVDNQTLFTLHRKNCSNTSSWKSVCFALEIFSSYVLFHIW